MSEYYDPQRNGAHSPDTYNGTNGSNAQSGGQLGHAPERALSPISLGGVGQEGAAGYSNGSADQGSISQQQQQQQQQQSALQLARKQLASWVGFSNLPNQVHRRSTK